jgi:hypothetical protein
VAAIDALELRQGRTADLQRLGACRDPVNALAELLEQRRAGVILQLLDLRRDGGCDRWSSSAEREKLSRRATPSNT